ncbi:BTAD domain-containing putative transcriptional regulator [Streptomyces sp. NPDC092296]|uniref:AfsR/SARP family transcriptional regulator n=1 Tax=Streptomyces sp. NPDC092296 TaxID=3366012 RepID=UPI003800A0A8
MAAEETALVRPVRFNLLGPLDVQAGDVSLALGGTRQRAVLGALLLAPGRVVPVDTLIEAVWPEGGPSTARTQISICVAGLRRIFKSGTGLDDLIATVRPGYVLRSREHRIDAVEFEKQVQQARAALRGGQAAEACLRFREGLRLWRGSVLDGLTGPLFEQEATRLQELRMNAVEEHAALLLLVGDNQRVVGELTGVLRDNPLREQARAHLMLAQYRLGRRAEALAVYREGRRILVEELGIEPGPPLRQLHDLVLRDAPELAVAPTAPSTAAAPATTAAGAPAATSVPAQLPAPVAAFTGRRQELAALDLLLHQRPARPPLTIAAISGVSGVGKSTLAVHWAHHVAERFPDGQLFVDLCGFDERHEPLSPASVLDRFLRALGVPGPSIPAEPSDRAALFRSVLSARRMLIVLDNASSADQVRPLLPGAGGSCVVITGRDLADDLIGDYRVVPIRLKAMSPEEASALLAKVVGADRIDAEPAAAARLGTLCDRLPLALRIAGARLANRAHWSVQGMVSRLEDQRTRLDELSPQTGGVRAGFRLTYRGLSPRAQQMYRRLGLLAVPHFSPWVGAALLDTDPAEAELLIDQLVEADLLEVDSATGPAHGPRYRFQDLLRLFARERAGADESEEQREAALDRVFDAWLGLAGHAYRYFNGRDSTPVHARYRLRLPRSMQDRMLHDPLEWLESERTAATDTVRQAAGTGRATHAWQLTRLCSPLWEARGQLDVWAKCAGLSLAAVRLAGDGLGEGMMLSSLGALAVHRNDYTEAEVRLPAAVRRLEECAEVGGRSTAQRLLAGCARLRGDLAAAREHCRASVEGFREIGDLAGEAASLACLARIELDCGDVEQSVELSHSAIGLSRKAGTVRCEAQSTYRLAAALLRQGDLEQAATALREVQALTEAYRDPGGLAHALYGLGQIDWRRGRLPDSRRRLEQALAIAQRTGDRLLQARIEAHLGCVAALAGDDGALHRLHSARGTFRALHADAWLRRVDALMDYLLGRGPGRPVDREELERRTVR